MRQREPKRALQAFAFRPKGSPCPFGTQPRCRGSTHVPNLPMSWISVSRFDQNCKSGVRSFLHSAPLFLSKERTDLVHTFTHLLIAVRPQQTQLFHVPFRP